MVVPGVTVVVVVTQLEEAHTQLYPVDVGTHKKPGVVHGLEAQKSTTVVVVAPA